MADYLQPAGLDYTPAPFQIGATKYSSGGSNGMATAGLAAIQALGSIGGAALQKKPETNQSSAYAYGAPVTSYLGSDFSITGGSGVNGASPANAVFSSGNGDTLTSINKMLPLILIGLFILLLVKGAKK